MIGLDDWFVGNTRKPFVGAQAGAGRGTAPNCPHMLCSAPHTWPCTRRRPVFGVPTTGRSLLSFVHKADRMSVSEYIEKHGLEKRVEEVLNACVKAKPAEPLEFMVRLRVIRSSSFAISAELRDLSATATLRRPVCRQRSC